MDRDNHKWPLVSSIYGSFKISPFPTVRLPAIETPECLSVLAVPLGCRQSFRVQYVDTAVLVTATLDMLTLQYVDIPVIRARL